MTWDALHASLRGCRGYSALRASSIPHGAQTKHSGLAGLLLNNLSVYRGCEIVFDSMDVPEQAVDCASGQQGPDEVRSLF